MENIATSVRINSDAMHILSELSLKLGRPKAQVIELALRDLEEKTFWSAVDRAFEQVAGDPAESDRQKAEIALWDRASDADFDADFKDERW